jgi:hemolysin-activating ACP:hemolysin acyltransferase
MFFSGYPNLFNQRLAEQLGYAAYLLTHVRGHHGREVTRHFNMLVTAIYHEHARFYFDSKGNPIAYAVWAYPSPSVQLRLSSDASYVLHESEWSEGGPPWIMDLVVQKGALRGVLRDLRETIFTSDKLVRFIHTKPSRQRVVTWRL